MDDISACFSLFHCSITLSSEPTSRQLTSERSYLIFGQKPTQSVDSEGSRASEAEQSCSVPKTDALLMYVPFLFLACSSAFALDECKVGPGSIFENRPSMIYSVYTLLQLSFLLMKSSLSRVPPSNIVPH